MRVTVHHPVFFYTVCLLAAACVSAPAAAEPARYQNPELHYSLRLPEGWAPIPAALIRQMSSVASNRFGVAPPQFVAGFQREGGRYFTYPYLLIQHHPDSHPSLDEISKAFGDPSSKAMQRKLESSRMLTDLSFDQPVVDEKRQLVLNRFRLIAEPAGAIQGVVAMMPGSAGVVQLNFYSLESAVEAELPLFQGILDSFAFEKGYEHRASPEQTVKRGAMLGAVWAAAIGATAVILLLAFRRERKAAAKRSEE